MGFGKEDQRGEAAFLSQQVKATCYQHDLPLMMLTHDHLAEAESVSLLHCEVTLPAPYAIFFYPVPFGRKSPSTAHT